jgi:hypothetical protein
MLQRFVLTSGGEKVESRYRGIGEDRPAGSQRLAEAILLLICRVEDTSDAIERDQNDG